MGFPAGRGTEEFRTVSPVKSASEPTKTAAGYFLSKGVDEDDGGKRGFRLVQPLILMVKRVRKIQMQKIFKIQRLFFNFSSDHFLNDKKLFYYNIT